VRTVLLAYAYGDSTTNLVQPFFAIPILAVTRMRFGDVVGYTFLIALACFAASAVAMALIPPDL
jgi:short-chain fatty acids transporter